MLQLFATKENPWAEKDIREIGLEHRVEQVIELETEWEVIAESVKWVPGVVGPREKNIFF